MGYPHYSVDCFEYWPCVTICGSMRFYNEMLRVAEELTLQGFIVLIPFVRKDAFMEADAEKLDRLHKRKIDLSQRIIVVSDETGYYGDSTKSEIDYATAQHKPIAFTQIVTSPCVK